MILIGDDRVSRATTFKDFPDDGVSAEDAPGRIEIIVPLDFNMEPPSLVCSAIFSCNGVSAKPLPSIAFLPTKSIFYP